MKIQIVSDLHLEFRTKKINDILIPSAPILAMLGDICVCGDNVNFDKFINFLNIFHNKFEKIIHISGNHEYYSDNPNPEQIKNNTMNLIDIKLKNLTNRFNNYHYLNNNTFEFTYLKKKYVFVGSTLWTHIPQTIKSIDVKTNKEHIIDLHKVIENRMNDYNYIYVNDVLKKTNNKYNYRQYTVSDMQKKHRAALNFIKKIIATASLDKTYILLTHHKPFFDKNTNMKDVFTYAYENDLANKLLVKPFVLAAYGHTHVHFDKKINGIRVISNPKGYIGQNTSFNNKFTVNV